MPKSAFTGAKAFEYPVETGAHKAMEVYHRLLKESPEDPPDLVIAADTVVVKGEEIMEKPNDAVDHARMLGELNDGEVRSQADHDRRDTRRADQSLYFAHSAKSSLESVLSTRRSSRQDTSYDPYLRSPKFSSLPTHQRCWKPTSPQEKAEIGQEALLSKSEGLCWSRAFRETTIMW